MSIRLYIKTLPSGLPKREAERCAACQLAEEAGLGLISHTPTGAPVINIPGVYISVSHNRDTCVLAVSNAPVGVDIESPQAKLRSIISRVSSTAETGIDPLHLWTAKEAVFKCAGIAEMVISQVTVAPDLLTATACGQTFALEYTTHNNALICTARKAIN